MINDFEEECVYLNEFISVLFTFYQWKKKPKKDHLSFYMENVLFLVHHLLTDAEFEWLFILQYFSEVKLQDQNCKTNCGDPTDAKSNFLHLTILSPFLFKLWNICSSSNFWIMSIFFVCAAILLFPDKIRICSTELKLWISICFVLYFWISIWSSQLANFHKYYFPFLSFCAGIRIMKRTL